MPGVTVGDHPRRGGTGKPPAPDPRRGVLEPSVGHEWDVGTMTSGIDMSRQGVKSNCARRIAQRWPWERPIEEVHAAKTGLYNS